MVEIFTAAAIFVITFTAVCMGLVVSSMFVSTSGPLSRRYREALITFIKQTTSDSQDGPDVHSDEFEELVRAEDEYAEQYRTLPLERAIELYKNDQLSKHIGRGDGGPRYAAAYRYCVKGRAWERLQGKKPETSKQAADDVYDFFDRDIRRLVNNTRKTLDGRQFDQWVQNARMLLSILPKDRRTAISVQLPYHAKAVPSHGSSGHLGSIGAAGVAMCMGGGC